MKKRCPTFGLDYMSVSTVDRNARNIPSDAGHTFQTGRPVETRTVVQETDKQDVVPVFQFTPVYSRICSSSGVSFQRPVLMRKCVQMSQVSVSQMERTPEDSGQMLL